MIEVYVNNYMKFLH